MKKIIALFIGCFLIASCHKNEPPSTCLDAVILWNGDPAADGLGWIIHAGFDRGRYYVPQNLPDRFKVDSLAVTVCFYETSEKFYCNSVQPLPKYHITSIKKR